MYCRTCGASLQSGSVICTNCGVPVGQGNHFCPNCAAETQPGAIVCVKCGTPLTNRSVQKSRLVAGLLGIFVGAWGIHNFYLGNTNRGILQIVLTLVTCGAAGLWGFIEGILILCGNINVDANNIPLKD